MVDDGVDVMLRSAITELTDADPGLRAAAAERLCHAGTQANAAALALVQACGDGDDCVREWVVAALEEIGPPPTVLIPELSRIAMATVPLVAYWAITLLGRSGQDAAVAVDTLEKSLTSSNLPVAQRAAWALGRIGPRAASSIPALRSAGARGDERLARLVVEAIAAIGA